MIDLSKEKPKTERIRGFAKTISLAIEVAQKNKKEKVDELIKGKRSRVVFNPKDGKWAALITIDNGSIDVKGIKNSPKNELKRKKLLWWGYMKAPIKDFMNAQNISSFKWFLRMITGRVKIRGIPHLRFISEIIGLAIPT